MVNAASPPSTASCCATCWEMKGQALAIAARDRGRRGDVRHLPVELRLAAAHRRTPTTSASASPTSSRGCKRAPARPGGAHRGRFPASRGARPRVVADVTLDVPGLDEPATGRLISVPARGTAAPQRRLPAPRALDRAGPAGRGAGERGVRRRRTASSPATASRPSSTGGAGTLHDRRHRRSRRSTSTRIPPGELIPDDRRFGVLWMERRALAQRLRHGGRLQRRRRCALAAGRLDRGGDRAARPAARALRRPGRDPARACRCRTGRSTTSCASSSSFGVLVPAHLPGRRRLPPERRAHARAGAAAAADRRAQGARLRQRARSGWHYVKWALLHRGARRARSASAAAPGWAPG